MIPGKRDHLKMRLLLLVRGINRASIERWSRFTYRCRERASPHAVKAVPACDLFAAPDLPAGLHVPDALPGFARLGRLYEIPYYLLAGLAFTLYRRFPIHGDAAWDDSVGLHLKSDEGWDAILDDDEFAQMRLQGPNPFLLTRAPDGDAWRVDYAGAFAGVCPPVRCEFALRSSTAEPPREAALTPVSIRIGDEVFRPGDAGWKRAKLLASALDARYTVFVQHLLVTHFIVGQAYALAALELPLGHRLRAFMDVHTYGTLHVNHYAWRLLLTPVSYFILSNFITREIALKLFQNGIERFRFDHLIPDLDARARGIDAIPGHPYLDDARLIWPVIREYAADVVAAFPDDAAIRDDAPLRAWHEKLVSLFPNPTETLRRLETREDLVTLMSCLVFNNVTHEVSGDFSPYVTSVDPYVKRLVNLARLLRDDDGPIALNDVFLFEQGAFSGMFNAAGNNMVDTPLERFVDDRVFLGCLRRFRESLRRLEPVLAARDEKRRFRLRRMRPRQWELSVSF